jgi:hypothetical protein
MPRPRSHPTPPHPTLSPHLDAALQFLQQQLALENVVAILALAHRQCCCELRAEAVSARRGCGVLLHLLPLCCSSHLGLQASGALAHSHYSRRA